MMVKQRKNTVFLKMMKEEVHTNEGEKNSQCQQCIASTDESKKTTCTLHKHPH